MAEAGPHPSSDASTALNVAIIGGGVSGVATCKALAARAIPCTLFEAQPRVGGLWVENYPGAEVQVSHHQYEYADATFPTPAHGLASAAEVISYCEAYVREWGLEGHLRLGTRVDRVAQRPGGGFVVETRPAGGDAGAEAARREFTHVVVCTGMFSSAGHRPDFPGLDKFGGLLLHSSERRDDAAELAGRRVMVIGGGKSAQEAAAAAQRAGAASVVMAMRRPHLMVPLRILGIIPYSKAYIRGARSGAIDVRVAEVARVGPASVTLRHGAQECRRARTEEEFPVDTLILGTGFVDSLQFLDAGIQEALGRQPDGLPLYRHIVPPSLPELLFVGKVSAVMAPVTASVQAAWVGELLQGRVELPDEKAMHAEAARWADALATAPLSSARRHLVHMQGNRYSQQLLSDMGVLHLARYGGPFGPVANAVMPQNPENFRNAVQPPGARKNRRLSPPLWLKVAVVAVGGAVWGALGSG